jgi:hypothetical protein
MAEKRKTRAKKPDVEGHGVTKSPVTKKADVEAHSVLKQVNKQVNK